MRRKKFLSILTKTVIGAGSLLIIYIRLKSDFTPDKLALLYESVFSAQGFVALAICLLLIPVNWGIESYKWQVITRPVEEINYSTAVKSVLSGVCVGNLAPGRATEFLAKIIYFDIENRPKITVLHFIGGMFQLTVTVLTGLIALIFMFSEFGPRFAWMVQLVSGIGVALIVLLVIAVIKIDKVLKYATKKISKKDIHPEYTYRFTPGLLSKLILFSLLRYLVFFVQFVLVISLFSTDPYTLAIFSGTAVYFFITATLPMISVLEAAIRAAVALVVFHGSGVSDTAVTLTSVLIWLFNIIVPSIAGYYILLQQNFDFKLFKTKR